jgi:hypothetical protein
MPAPHQKSALAPRGVYKHFLSKVGEKVGNKVIDKAVDAGIGALQAYIQAKLGIGG